MKRYLIGTALLVICLTAGGGLYLIFSGPHMTVQQHIRAFQAITPLPPPEALPRGAEPALAELARQNLLHNPLADTPGNRAKGRVYYRYYCIFCHGRGGSGTAPVGDSYMPRPPNLQRARLGQLTDSELLLAMLTGVGHSPVLPRVVVPRHRWPLVLYVRTLSRGEKDGTAH